VPAPAPTALRADPETSWALAAFGMVLRDSPYRGDCTLALAERLARAGDPRSDDAREEFLELLRAAEALDRER
jgi:hypothetical protein